MTSGSHTARNVPLPVPGLLLANPIQGEAMSFYEEDMVDSREGDLPARPRTFEGVEGTATFERLGKQAESAHGQLHFSFDGRSERPLWIPNQAMRKVHSIANQSIKTFILGMPASTWGSHVNAQNAAANGPYIYVVDIKNAFGSIDGKCLAGLFQKNISRCPDIWGETVEETFELLQRYFLSPDGGLYQGGPASPWLFEFYVRRLLDDVFEQRPVRRKFLGGGLIPPTWAYINQVTCSRYVDDLVFASSSPIGARKRQYIKRIIRQAGFAVNEQKTRGIVLRKQTVVLNGVAVRLTSRGARIFLPRSKLRQIEGLIHKAARGDEVDTAVIHGSMGLFKVVNPTGSYNASERRVWDAYRQLFPEKKPEVFCDIFF